MDKQKMDRNYMSRFLRKCIENAEFIHRQKKGDPLIKSIFTIASTSKDEASSLNPYLTPIRSNMYFIVTGAVVFNQAQAISIARRLDGLIDIIAVDAEKKVPILAITEKSLLAKEALEALKENTRTVGLVDSGNIASICCNLIKRSKFIEFKANDLTVDAVWAFVSSKLKYFSAKKIAIIGAGNIGSKLALKFVESGAEVVINRRDKYIGNTVANAINLIKPAMTIANVSYTDSIIKACFLADVIIGANYGDPSIEWEHIVVSKQDVLLLDVGKSSISKEAIRKAFQNKKEIYRIDVSAALEGYLLMLLKNDESIKMRLGRRVIKGVGIVSGGFLGHKGDIVVDNIYEPKSIIGIADGEGDFLRRIDRASLRKVDLLKKSFQLHDNIIY